MKTSERVRQLGLYVSDCCTDEALFDAGDRFARCPKCEGLCRWELLEQVVSWLEMDAQELQAA